VKDWQIFASLHMFSQFDAVGTAETVPMGWILTILLPGARQEADEKEEGGRGEEEGRKRGGRGEGERKRRRGRKGEKEKKGKKRRETKGKKGQRHSKVRKYMCLLGGPPFNPKPQTLNPKTLNSKP